MKGIFSVLVENRDGVLSSISGLFARRGFNIDSLAVGETDNHEISSMTIISTGDQRTIDQIEKQLNKKVNVIRVRRLNACEDWRAFGKDIFQSSLGHVLHVINKWEVVSLSGFSVKEHNVVIGCFHSCV